jgi:signal transduction histidine kinase
VFPTDGDKIAIGGLGLAVSQSILLEHRGRIVVENRPPVEGAGAAFEVQLPAVR